MRIDMLRKVIGVVAGVCLGPALLMASPRPTLTGTPFKGKNLQETSYLLKRVEGEAFKVQKDAGELQAYVTQPDLYDWQLDGSLLNRIRSRVNAMDADLYKLRKMQGKVSAVQQKAINRVAPTVVDLSDTTSLAIASFNRNRYHIFTSHLKEYASDLHDQAGLIGNSVEDFQHYARTRRELRHLRRELQMKAVS